MLHVEGGKTKTMMICVVGRKVTHLILFFEETTNRTVYKDISR